MIPTLKTIARPFKNKAISLYRTIVPEKSPVYHRLSYAQEGEDMILARIFYHQPNGFYVDVGAYHPQMISNTYYFYLQGWRGINIDAMPGSMDSFNKIRPNDINLEIPLSDTKQNLTYYKFNHSNLNGFSKKISEQRDGCSVGDWEVKLISEIELQTSTLSEVLDKYLPPAQTIDFLNVDVEGLDYEVLKSNNWQKYRPKIVLVEVLETLIIEEIKQAPIPAFMYEQGYQLYGKSGYTLIFKRDDFQVI
jgi:FkbM family methyltransferase